MSRFAIVSHESDLKNLTHEKGASTRFTHCSEQQFAVGSANKHFSDLCFIIDLHVREVTRMINVLRFILYSIQYEKRNERNKSG